MTENLPDLKIYKLNPDVELPTFATEGAACFDVRFQIGYSKEYTGFNATNSQFTREFSDNKLVIMPGERVLVPTGLIFDIPEGHSLRVHIRSSIALKRGLILANGEGVIDSDYFHQSFVILYNSTTIKQTLESGERIAQMELVPNYYFTVTEVKKEPKQKTDRTGGFGSTGTT